MSRDVDLVAKLELCMSNSCTWLEPRGADNKIYWPLAWTSKRQCSIKTLTCESEMTNLATALESEVLLILELLEQAHGKPFKLRCLEDNTQFFQAAETGDSAALQQFLRKKRTSTGVVHEILSEKISISCFTRRCLPKRETCFPNGLTQALSNLH